MISHKLIRLFAVGGFLLLLAVAKPFVIVRAGLVGVVCSFGSIVGQVDEAKLPRAEEEALAMQRLSASLTIFAGLT